MQITNIFKNIQKLHIGNYNVKPIDHKINLPCLTTLELMDSNIFQNFSRLNSLREISITDLFDKIKNIDELFDASKILELKIDRI